MFGASNKGATLEWSGLSIGLEVWLLGDPLPIVEPGELRVREKSGHSTQEGEKTNRSRGGRYKDKFPKEIKKRNKNAI